MNCLPLDAQKIIMNNYYWTNAKTGYTESFNDQPCVVFMSGLYAGSKYWYKNGLRHRDNDKPAEISRDGREFYYLDGKKIFSKK